MIFSDREIKISESLTEEKWAEIIAVVSGKDDLTLKVEGVDVFLKEMSIPREISGVSINNAVFKNKIKISGLSNGRFLLVKNSRSSFLSGVRIENVSCNLFEFSDSENMISSDDEMNLIVTFTSCGFDNFIYSSFFLPSFNKVLFSDKVKIESMSDNNDNSLHFIECIFSDGLSCELVNFKNKNLFIENSKTIENHEKEKITVTFSCRGGDLNNFEIKHSVLTGAYFKLFKTNFCDIAIDQCVIEELDLHTVNDGNDRTEIYNLHITNSNVGMLLLNNRDIVHPLSFVGSTFKNPPHFFGAKITSGSRFPNRENFISRNGKRDAACYRVLRSHMEAQRDRTLEGMFFSLEQESLCNEENGIEHYISKMYHVFSNYGTDYIKPLLLLLAFAVIFTFIYGLYMSESIGLSNPIDWDLLKSSFIYSLKQILQPFSSLKDMTPLGDGKGELSLVIILVSILQSFISLVCIALSGLAIRWRFKRD